MCLAAAFEREATGPPILQEIARVRVDGDMIELENLFGDKKVVQGIIAEIDFMTSKILIKAQ